MNLYNTQTQKLRFFVCQTYPILQAFNRRDELLRLVKWASAKRATGALRLYRSRLIDEERRLFRYHHNSPLAYQWATILFWINRLISPTPRYLPKGSARAYRYLKRESRHYWDHPIV
jgi:hypothetical protein